MGVDQAVVTCDPEPVGPRRTTRAHPTSSCSTTPVASTPNRVGQSTYTPWTGRRTSGFHGPMDHRTWVEIRKIRKTPEERCKLRDFCQAREYFKPEGDGSGFYGSVLDEPYAQEEVLFMYH